MNRKLTESVRNSPPSQEFQAKFPELCDPQGAYTPMSSKEHLDDCRRWIKDTRKLWRTSKR